MSPKKKIDEEAPTDVKPIQDSTPIAETPAAVPEPAAPTEAAPPAVANGALALTARQYIRARGYRWERAAGFLLEQAQQLGREARMTLAEWQPRWDAFWQRPVK